MQERKLSMMLARFPYGGVERAEIADWLAQASAWANSHPQIERFLLWHIDDTPTPMCRNRAVRTAIDERVDVLVMLDADMIPDIDPKHPFLPSAFKHLLGRFDYAPTLVAAPYCMANERPAVGRWRSKHDGAPFRADMFTREEAAQATGIQPAALLPTGLLMIDMRVFTGWKGVKLPIPWFAYEWTTPEQTHKGSTEDIVFSRNVSMLFANEGVETNFADWDSWAWHVKSVPIGKPYDLSVLDVSRMIKGNHGNDNSST